MNIQTIQTNILSRYAQEGRSLPWRQTQDPYAIHVSEVMLQQTQVDRVIPYFLKRMEDFPTYHALATASKTELLRHRSWLGFNSRALRLQQCAKEIIEKWFILKKDKIKIWKDSNLLPSTFYLLHSRQLLQEIRSSLQTLPGIGPYTSAAIMAFAWNMPVPVIDTNIRRVLIFLFKLPETIAPSALEAFAQKLIPEGQSRNWHNALMDQWALLLTARKTKIKPISKQSKFEWSDRQVRGWIMKQLTTRNEQLKTKEVEEEFPRKNVKEIIEWMKKEWLITICKWIIKIQE